MANAINRDVNEMLVTLFNSVLEMEAKAVITEEFSDITDNDMHIIEAIGIREPQKVSDVAKKRNVTAGTLTINMNSLEKKGYIIRERSSEDKRVVHAILTERGRKAFFHHRDFHKHMIKSAVKGFNSEELRVLTECLKKLTDFCNNYSYPE